MININGYTYKDSFDALKNYFGNQLQISCLGYYIRFKDPIWNDIISNLYGDGIGTTREMIELATVYNASNLYNENVDIIDFSPFNNLKVNDGIITLKNNASAAYIKGKKGSRGNNVAFSHFSNPNAYIYVTGIYNLDGRWGTNNNVIVVNDTYIFHNYFFRQSSYNDIYITNNGERGEIVKVSFAYDSKPSNLHGHIYVPSDEYATYAADSNWAKFGDKLQPYDFDADPDNILPEHTGYFVM